jgi:hypothetical protein
MIDIARELWGGIVKLWDIAASWARQHITLFRLLYWTVAIATFRHSAIGFSTLEAGSFALGALAAVAIDVGMMLAAERLRDTQGARIPLVAGLALAALASIYSQLLYTVTNAAAVTVAPGATWMHGWAEGIINARVVVIPFILPILAVVYSFASRPVEIVPSAEKVQFDAAEIAQPATKTEAARLILAAVPNADNGTVAELVGCSRSTVRLARNGGGK